MPAFTVRALQPHEIHDAAHLVALAYGEAWRRDFWHNLLPDKPGFSFEHIRAGFLGDELVSLLLVEPLTLHYGQAQLRLGGIGSACTHPDHRNQGYASAVMHDSLTFLAEQGVHLALLNGIAHFYHRFGFSPVWADYRLSFALRNTVDLKPIWKVRPATPQEIPQLSALYRKHWDGRVSLRRSQASWAWRIRASRFPVMVVGGVQVHGYLWYEDDFPNRVEVVADRLEAVEALIAYAARQGRLSWSVPPDDAIISWARQLLPITLSAHYDPHGGWMARLIATPALVQNILTELRAHVQMLYPAFDAQQLHFDIQPDTVVLGVRDRPSTHMTIAHMDFTQILFGSLSPTMLGTRDNLAPDSVRLLEMLFPPRVTAIAAWDWF